MEDKGFTASIIYYIDDTNTIENVNFNAWSYMTSYIFMTLLSFFESPPEKC